MIPLLTRIEQQLAQCADPDRRAELLAERASYLARTGHFAEANEILATLRRSYGDGRNARVSVWIMFVEGLVLYFADYDPVARDRILRANLISCAVQFDEMKSLTEVWLAHIDFNKSDFESALLYLERWQRSKVGAECPSGLRFSLLFADALMHCGEIKQSKLWYEKTRLQAVRLGDEATLAAMIYNKAAMGLGRLRIDSARGAVDPELIRFVSMEIASARNFHFGAGHKALPQIIEACVARVLLLQDRCVEALPLFSRLLEDESMRLGFVSDRTLLRTEYAQCLVRVGESRLAQELLDGLRVVEYTKMTLDDQFVFLHSYCALLKSLNLSPLVSEYEMRALECQAKMDAEMAIFRRGLLEILNVCV